jgi:DNA repair ATPase RecN
MYPTKEGTFVAACQELCLVLEGKDQEYLKLKILANAKSYLVNVCRKKLGEHLLNQSLPKDILDEFTAYRVKSQNELFQKWHESIEKIKSLKKDDCLVTP